jgi:toxin ParE1/3/4
VKLVYLEAAKSDINALFVYIAIDNSVSVADYVVDKVTSTCEDLARFPGMGRRRPDLDAHDCEVRSIPSGSYTIYYTERDSQVFVVRILHTARDHQPIHMEGMSELP